MAGSRTAPGRSDTAGILDALVALGEEVLAALPGELSGLGPFQMVTLGYLVRSLRDAQAVAVLCREELTEQAILQARSIWEGAVTVEYIRRDPEERARLYIEYDAVMRWRTLEKARKSPELRGSQSLLDASQARKGELEELERQYKAVSGRYPDPSHWAGRGMTVRKLAEAVGLESDYSFLYSWLSEQVHGTITAIGRQFVLGKEDTLVVLPGQYREQAVMVAAAWFSHVLAVFDEAHGLGFGQRIEKLQIKLGSSEP